MPPVSLIPFGGPEMWIGRSLSLLAHGETGAAPGLFDGLRGWADNLIRPLLISA
jgi:hypothetical protein